jgi:hypothetical protein
MILTLTFALTISHSPWKFETILLWWVHETCRIAMTKTKPKKKTPKNMQVTTAYNPQVCKLWHLSIIISPFLWAQRDLITMQAHYHTWKLEAKEKKYMSQWNKESQEESAPTTNKLTILTMHKAKVNNEEHLQ